MSTFSFIPRPTKQSIGNRSVYKWEGLEIRTTEKGRSVFADNIIEPGTIIPYGGKLLSAIEYLRIKDSPQLCQWICEGIKETKKSDSEVKTWLDANPSNYPRGCPDYAWIGSLINEPNRNTSETENCKLIDWRSKCKIPTYPYIIKYPDTFIVVEVMHHIYPPRIAPRLRLG